MTTLTPVDYDPFAPKAEPKSSPMDLVKWLNPAVAIGGEISKNPRTALEQSMQGATFNMGDEVSDALGSGIAYISDKVRGVDGGSYSDIYAGAREDSQKRLAKQLQEAPGLAIGSQIAGGLLTGGAGATTKGGAALSNSLRSGAILGKDLGLAGRVAKGAAAGASAAGAAGFGAGSGAEDRVDRGVASLPAGIVMGAAVPAGGTIINKVKSATAKQVVPTSDEIKALANNAYKIADEKGGTLKGWFTNRFLDDIKDIQPASVAGKKVPTDPKLSEALDYVNSFKNTRLSLQDAQNLDEYLSDAIDGFTELGRVNKSGQKLLEVQNKFRNMIEQADESLVDGGKEGFDALKEGRKLWSKQMKLRDIERMIARAERTDNPATSLRASARTLLDNAKKSRGYSKKELELFAKMADGSVTMDILKTGGSRLIPIIMGSTGGPLGAAVGTAGSMASRGLATRNAMMNANRLAAEVATGGASTAKSLALPSPVRTSPAIGVLGSDKPEPKVQPAPSTSYTPVDYDPFAAPIPQADGSLADKIKQAESAGDPNARNPNSSASGLYQFTDGTWRSAVDKWGRSRGIKYSDKNNPQAQELLMQELTRDNARILQDKGIEPTDGNLYFAHFLGAPAASKAIGMLGKNASAARSFPAAAKANPNIFFSGGKPRTIEEVYALITSKVG